MRPLFRTSHATTIAFAITLLIAPAVEVRQSTKQREEATAHDGGSHYVFRLCAFAAVVCAVAALRSAPGADIHADRTLFFVIALVVIWTGFGFRWWAFRTLGSYFTFVVMTSSDQQVVTDGPYRVVRHPGYAGATLALVGVGLAYGNWLSLAAFTVLPLVAVVYRIRVEEKALRDTLGERYWSYARERKRLVPFVW